MADVLEFAREGLGDDPHGYRRGFIELVEAARELGLGERDVAAR